MTGKRVLLLGNGVSFKEIALLALDPDLLVYTDLSLGAVTRVRESITDIASNSPIVFAAVDATRLPFREDSFDVVYAYAVVHHLERVDDFLADVVRVLAPGGRAVFMDDGYVPAWQAIKTTWLRPIMAYAHRRQGISPEDLRATLTGGFREEDLARTILALDGHPWFERTSLITYLLYRATSRLLPNRLHQALESAGIARRIRQLDEWAAHFEVVRRNRIRLVWGLVKD